MTRQPVQFDDDLDAPTRQELETALRFFYAEVAVEPRAPKGFSVLGADSETPENLHRIVRHFLESHRAITPRTIRTRPSDRVCSLAFPAADVIEVARGTFLQGPAWSGAIEATRRLVRRHVASRFPSAPHLTGSALVPREILVRAGYYKNFPNLVNSVGRIRGNYWDAVAIAELDMSQRDAGDTLSSFYPASDVVLTPAVCYPVYAYADLLIEHHHSTIFTIEGPAFRHESNNHDRNRLAEFSMFEIARMGSRGEVEAQHGQFLEAFEALFDTLDLPYRVVTAADAFYGSSPALKRDAQLASQAKFEVRVEVGASEMAVASVNLHGSVFADAFGLSGLGELTTTCCAAIGIERLAYVLQCYDAVPARAESS